MKVHRLRRDGRLRWACVAPLLVACGGTPAPSAVSAAATPSITTTQSTTSIPAIVEQRIDANGVSYVFKASRLTNLAWQLDCLAGFGRCSQPAYEALWQDRLQSEPDLKTALTQWGELRRKLRGPVGDHPESQSRLPLPQLRADLWQRVRLASVTAADETQYRSHLSVLTDTESANALSAVIERFDRAFGSIWAQALPVLTRAITERAALHRRQEVALMIERAFAFYGGDAGAPLTMRFDLLYRPEHPSADFATQLLDHGLIEVVGSAKPEVAMQPPVHEMFHYLFASAGFSKLDDLASRFVTSADPNALGAYGLLDEVLATGLAQGVLGGELAPTELQERLAIPRKLYDDPFIDAVTKAFLPELRALLQKPKPGGTVFSPEFQPAYLDAVKTAFPRGLPPAAELRPLACAYSKDFQKAYDALRAASASPLVGSSDQLDEEDTRALLEDHSTWSRVLLLKTTELGVLHRYAKSVPGAEAALHSAARHNQRFAYATRVAGSGPVFVLVADDDQQARQLVAEFIRLESPFAGLALLSRRGGS